MTNAEKQGHRGSLGKPGSCGEIVKSMSKVVEIAEKQDHRGSMAS